MDLKGWKRIQDVEIPQVETVGFTENIMIREPVQPIQYPAAGQTAASGIVLPDGDDDKTVLVEPQVPQGSICRLSTGEEAVIHKDLFRIGKSSQCDFVVKDNATVSRCHAQIRRNGDQYFLKDMGSSNHTFVEDRKIQEEVELADGMIFRLSDEKFQFRIKMG